MGEAMWGEVQGCMGILCTFCYFTVDLKQSSFFFFLKHAYSQKILKCKERKACGARVTLQMTSGGLQRDNNKTAACMSSGHRTALAVQWLQEDSSLWLTQQQVPTGGAGPSMS